MRIALVYADDFSLWHFHRNLLTRLTDAGHEVFAVTAPGEYASRFESIGVRHVSVPIHRFMSPLRDLSLLLEFYRVFHELRLDVVHTFTIKPNIYGTTAARMAGVKCVIGTAEGLGYMYGEDVGWKLRLMRPVVNALYRLGCWMSHRFWFVNPDDRDLFVRHHIVNPDKAFLTISAGVDVQTYSRAEIDQPRARALRERWELEDGMTTVVMVVARVIWSKGVREFVEAAEIVTGKHPSVRFLLVGPLEEESPEAVPLDYLRTKEASTNFRWTGFVDDIKAAYAIADIVTLPSYYREGVPNVLLEAMAIGKPVVTTDHIGCREVVEEGRNGFLVPVKDGRALARALETLVTDRKVRESFGRYSRVMVERDFDKSKIIDRIMEDLYGTEGPSGAPTQSRALGAIPDALKE